MAKIGEFNLSLELSKQVLAIDVNNVDALLKSGRCFAMLGQNNKAIKALEKLTIVQPENIEVYNLLGHLFLNVSKPDLAIDAFNRCLELNPKHVEAMRHIANWNCSSGNLTKSLQLYEKCVAISPRHCDLLFDFASALFFTYGNTNKAADLCRRSIELGNISADRGSVALQILNYASNQKTETIAMLHREWAEKHADSLGQSVDFKTHDFKTDRTLRIGLLSADFIPHPVGRYALALCDNLNKKSFSLFIYSNKKKSKLKVSFEKCATWRNIYGIEDDKVVDAIRADKIDILIDLSGHTAFARLMVLAKRPAPISAAVFAYPNTTGMKAVDYRISDPHSDPIGYTESLWTEQIDRMENAAWIYLPMLDYEINPNPLPFSTGAPFTFGCLNNPNKTNRACVRLWAQVLKRLHNSRIILFQINDHHGKLLRKQFAEDGANPEQIDTRKKGNSVYFRKLHNEIDLMFDPFPYNGGITTCDSFWMGVPVLCLEGKSYVSRQGVMQNKCLGLDAFVATDEEEFIEKALQISNNPELLKQLRENLREMLKRSPLMNYNSYANQFAEMLRRWWAKRCNEEKLK